jgi:hypothetical protein
VTLTPVLAQWIAQVGDANLLDALPAPTLYRALAHTDDVLFVRVSDPFLELPDLDLEAGYQLYDEAFTLLGAHSATTGLTEPVWGYGEVDWFFLLSYTFGYYAYLYYTNTEGETRTLMLVHAG